MHAEVRNRGIQRYCIDAFRGTVSVYSWPLIQCIRYLRIDAFGTCVSMLYHSPYLPIDFICIYAFTCFSYEKWLNKCICYNKGKFRFASREPLWKQKEVKLYFNEIVIFSFPINQDLWSLVKRGLRLAIGVFDTVVRLCRTKNRGLFAYFLARQKVGRRRQWNEK